MKLKEGESLMGFKFWRGWLIFVFLVSLAVGIVLIFFPDSPVMSLYNKKVAAAFYATDQVPTQFLAHHTWVMAVLGSAIIGWGITLLFLTIFAFKERNRWAWNCMAIAVPIWVIIDSLASIKAGVYMEFIFNLVFLVAVLIPLIKTYGYFYRKRDTPIEE